MVEPGFYQGRILDRKLRGNVTCPYCKKRCRSISDKRKHMQVCEQK